MLALDGVYAEDSDGFIRFHTVAPPSGAEVGRVAALVTTSRVRRGSPQCWRANPPMMQKGQPLFLQMSWMFRARERGSVIGLQRRFS